MSNEFSHPEDLFQFVIDNNPSRSFNHNAFSLYYALLMHDKLKTYPPDHPEWQEIHEVHSRNKVIFSAYKKASEFIEKDYMAVKRITNDYRRIFNP